MIITKENTGEFGSFKLGYSRGLPSYQAPKVLTKKKTEEYFVTSLLAQILLYNKIQVIGVEVCEDDSDKGADTIIKILNENPIEIQITRFTLTEYLKRRKVAEKQVDSLIRDTLPLTDINFPVNVTVNLYKTHNNPFNNRKLKSLLAQEIATAINFYKEQLPHSNNFFNHEVTKEKLKNITPLITLQRIPQGFYSNFYGRDNIYIDLDFDNIGFNQNDIDDECLNIYKKKNGGKAKTLIIWADTFEILYDPKRIIDSLKTKFRKTTFDEVFFFNFYNSMPLFFEFQIGTAKIK
nr:hypothetical protein [uncultured Flavobacterium sp.]